ncbi:sensor histidine kinase [Aporhodopirellula aestuarii]|uniref:histidine kinase n=1 Tax=Aporhodopirellula aestuarii TaxID=2950107 RepID=A0ABT0U935_9BACT|nr:HAMP domain-containing sensor histidine kinase [Aporhodopirellula aestuarii]MCM2373483.1 HAMP domain-containing histidine kinase [Aporhodopirellula aestuarii]
MSTPNPSDRTPVGSDSQVQKTRPNDEKPPKLTKTRPKPLVRPITLRAPITLGVVLIVLVVILSAVWVTGTLWGLLRGQASPELFWVMLLAGSVLLIAVLAGVIAYLTLSVKAFNLNRRQSNFIDAVTHELKSPIASLKLYLQTMSRHTVNAEQQQEFHKIMLDDVERLDSLINHLLDAARVERGTEPEEATDFQLSKLLSNVSSAACVRHKMPAETVCIDCPDIVLHAPAVQVEILFRNLIDNAIKYGGTPPHVRVTARMQTDKAGEVTVSVCDNGAGIPANLRRKVFGRFVRLGNELERSKPGTGLGLYLVRNVTHALGGRINIGDADVSADPETTDAASQPTRGTRFDITLTEARLMSEPPVPAPEPPINAE